MIILSPQSRLSNKKTSRSWLEFFLNIYTIIFTILVQFFFSFFISPHYKFPARIIKAITVSFFANKPDYNWHIQTKHFCTLGGQSPPSLSLDNLKRIYLTILIIVDSGHFVAVINGKCISPD